MASAVERPPSPLPTLPTNDTDEKPDSSKKRRLSPDNSEHEDTSRSPKRTRAGSPFNRDASLRNQPPSPPSTTTSNTTRRDNHKPPNRPDSIQEEKKRSRRLFGGLLSTLSQSTPSTHQKRRQDIERRQQERAHQQRSEDDKIKGKNLAKLRKLRMVEQVRFDEQVMKTQHRDVLAKARFLRTRCEPSVYYLPWRPTEMQTEQIDRQIRDAKHLVQQEEDDFTLRKRQRLKDLGVPPKQDHDMPDTTGRSHHHEHGDRNKEKDDERSQGKDFDMTQDGHTEKQVSPPRTEGKGSGAAAPVDHESTHPAAVSQEEENDDNGDADVMVEDDEDAVIY